MFIWFVHTSPLHFTQAVVPNHILRVRTGSYDNPITINLADNPINHLKMKHIVVHYHAIWDHIGNRKICLEHLPTDKMIADALMKATHDNAHTRFLDSVGMDRLEHERRSFNTNGS